MKKKVARWANREKQSCNTKDRGGKEMLLALEQIPKDSPWGPCCSSTVGALVLKKKNTVCGVSMLWPVFFLAKGSSPQRRSPLEQGKSVRKEQKQQNGTATDQQQPQCPILPVQWRARVRGVGNEGMKLIWE